MYMSIVTSPCAPISLGRDAINPKKDTTADANEVMDSANTLPVAISLRSTGVTNRLAIVPRSFSPAMDSLDNAIHPENRNITNKYGAIIVITMIEVSSLVARS